MPCQQLRNRSRDLKDWEVFEFSSSAVNSDCGTEQKKQREYKTYIVYCFIYLLFQLFIYLLCVCGCVRDVFVCYYSLFNAILYRFYTHMYLLETQGICSGSQQWWWRGSEARQPKSGTTTTNVQIHFHERE